MKDQPEVHSYALLVAGGQLFVGQSGEGLFEARELVMRATLRTLNEGGQGVVGLCRAMAPTAAAAAELSMGSAIARVVHVCRALRVTSNMDLQPVLQTDELARAIAGGKRAD